MESTPPKWRKFTRACQDSARRCQARRDPNHLGLRAVARSVESDGAVRDFGPTQMRRTTRASTATVRSGYAKHGLSSTSMIEGSRLM